MMETNTSTDAPYLDSAWKQRTATATQSFETTPVTRTSKKTYPLYAAAASTVSDQVSGMTEPDPSLRGIRHEELSNKIATLEAMIAQLCKQVQPLTDQSLTHSNCTPPLGKRTVRKESRQKEHEQAQQFSALKSATEGTNEQAPMNKDCLTAACWDHYTLQHKNNY
ncbi:hypothetical protein MHU86_9491 [Fragilaria crotonensis]|nr:hypothetical protein MHU86_9491 [Fragilaria crotonensis]